MGRLLLLNADGARLGAALPDGAFRPARAAIVAPDLAQTNAGQGDGRERIKANVAQAQAPAITAWEGGALPGLTAWRDQSGPALVLMPQDDPLVLRDRLRELKLIAIEFPRATDGRGYSLARIIRERLGWRGDLRAVGDVQIDQLSFLARCGFSSVALRADQDARLALGALKTFPDAYQSAADAHTPLYLRRGAA
jgi:uncharacterized protein (DUF934 family)